MRLSIKICDDLPDHVKTYLHQYYGKCSGPYQYDSGLDLVVPFNYQIEPHTTVVIRTGICCQNVGDTPHGYYLYPRSSLAKTPLRLSNSVGIIDWGYTGEIKAYVDNISDSTYCIDVWNQSNSESKVVKLFQLCSPNLTAIKTNVVNTLTTTERGAKGFGSSH